jgi:hypothetical protein
MRAKILARPFFPFGHTQARLPQRPVGGEFPIVLPRSLNQSTITVMQSGPNQNSVPGFTQGRRTRVAFNRSTSRGTDFPALAALTGQAAIGV